MGREARVDRALEPRHVEEHVDGDDDDQDQREEEQHRREGGALGELDRLLCVSRDLARTKPVDPFVHLLADLDAVEPVVVEPRLEAVDVVFRSRLTAVELLRDVVVDPFRSIAGLVERDDSDGDEHRGDDGRKDQIDEHHRQRPRELQPRQVPNERVEHERDDRRGQEEEQHMAERRGEQERENQQNR